MSGRSFNYVKWGFLVTAAGSIAAVLTVPEIRCNIGLLSDTCSVLQKDVELVTKTEAGEALEGVQVEVIAQKGPPKPGLTDINGYVKVKILATEDVLVTTSKTGYPTQSFTINLLADKNQVRIVRLAKSGQLKVSSASAISDVVVASSSLPPSPPPVKAEINQPLEGSLLDRNTKAAGTLTNLAAGDSLWIYVFSSGEKRYYPSKATYDPDTKMWQRSLIIGSVEKEESGASFEIGLFTANSQMSENLSKWGENGTSTLPAGIVPLKSVIVKRK